MLQAKQNAPNEAATRGLNHALDNLEKAVVGVRATEPLVANAVQEPFPVLSDTFAMGTARSPDGQEITVNSQSLLRNGKPWLPVMGEFHYARYPQPGWRDALLKIRAGGIDIVATYVFWIHHEESEGCFDWSEARSLRRFAALCGQLGLLLVVRCGPWCHGECRNGGFPDWLLTKGFTPRSDDPGYLHAARRFYREIAGQLQGLLWKDGGPVIGIQCENEYTGPAEHLLSLKRIAREVGLDVPLYTRTGWPDLRSPLPLGELLPLFGGYAEGFWDRTLAAMPPNYRANYHFVPSRVDMAIASDQLGEREAKDDDETRFYPYFACEIGGGMECSYHRRIRIAPEDIEALSLVKIGAGSNLQGYYMVHGGTNPEGRFSTLQESQATGYWNDLPVKSYDYQAPLGEYGQLRPHYHSLRRLHLFLRDYGAALAVMPAYLPEKRPASTDDITTLRWSLRTDGQSGFLFINNYQRLHPLAAKEGVQFDLSLPDTTVRLPCAPCAIPANSACFWPVHLDMGGAHLLYATAQPVCRLQEEGMLTLVFAEVADLPAEFVFARAGVTLESVQGDPEITNIEITDSALHLRNVVSGTGAALCLRVASGLCVRILLLDAAQSLTCWKETLWGQERLFLTAASLVVDGDTVTLRASDPAHLTLAMLPAPPALAAKGAAVSQSEEGLFRRFTASLPPAEAKAISWEAVQSAGTPRAITMGSKGVAEAPTDADFAQAAVWRLRLAAGPVSDCRLRIHYIGDVARLYRDGKLVADNFYNGIPFEVGLARHTPEGNSGEWLLKILPLRKEAPIALPPEAWPDFGAAESLAILHKIEVVEEHQVRFTTCGPLPERP